MVNEKKYSVYSDTCHKELQWSEFLALAYLQVVETGVSANRWMLSSTTSSNSKRSMPFPLGERTHDALRLLWTHLSWRSLQTAVMTSRFPRMLISMTRDRKQMRASVFTIPLLWKHRKQTRGVWVYVPARACARACAGGTFKAKINCWWLKFCKWQVTFDHNRDPTQYILFTGIRTD